MSTESELGKQSALV